MLVSVPERVEAIQSLAEVLESIAGGEDAALVLRLPDPGREDRGRALLGLQFCISGRGPVIQRFLSCRDAVCRSDRVWF